MLINPNLILSHFTTTHQPPLSSPTLTHSQSHHWPKMSPPVQALSPLSLKRPRQQAPQVIKHLSSPRRTLIFLTSL